MTYLTTDQRRALCGIYTDTRFGDRINIGGAREDWATAHLADGTPMGDYAWGTVAKLVREGTWKR